MSAQQPREVDIELPGAHVVVHERAHDHLRVTAFSRAVSDSRINAYLRVKGQNRFVEKKDYRELVPAPKGGKVAGEPQSSPGAFNSVVIFDAKGKPTRIRTVRKPLETKSIQWSRDGRKLVLTIEKNLSTVGFVTIDVAKRTVKDVHVRGVDPFSAFQWTPDGKHLAVGYADPHQGVRLYRTDGRVHRTLRKIGWIVGDDAFSPSGKQLLTVCPPTYAESSYCLWDVRSGKLATRVKINFVSTQGWWDEHHLVSTVSGDDAQLVAVIDLKGKVTRVLAHDRAGLGRGVALVYTPSD
ncbi:WD40 repeat domain-containing protein [Nonomuraea sp. NPDC049758]|uniref:WD40 repeat domain-containing protein n=1 Tax=Nonomuraea sp. NPDC049758 TaxID=3154360 RepID=UPI00341A36C8